MSGRVLIVLMARSVDVNAMNKQCETNERGARASSTRAEAPHIIAYSQTILSFSCLSVVKKTRCIFQRYLL